MIDCDLKPLIGAYHDRELDAESTARLDRHVVECPVCSMELAALRELSARLAGSVPSDITEAESTRLHAAIEAAAGSSADRLDRLPLFRTVGLLTALAASVLIVCGVWLIDTRPGTAEIAGATSLPSQWPANVVTAPEWERVAVTLHADPRPTVAGGEMVNYALRDSSTVDWMIEGLIP